MTAQKLVNAQAEDEGLWFAAQTAPEAYLQAALRKLHASVEADAHMLGYWKSRAMASERLLAQAGIPLPAPPDDGEAVALTPIQQEAMKLCEPPFRFEGGYVFDAHHKMVSDDGPILDADKNGCVQRVRGWGRIGQLPDGAALQDAMGEVLAIALNRLYSAPRVDAQETERLRTDAERYRWLRGRSLVNGRWPEGPMICVNVTDVPSMLREYAADRDIDAARADLSSEGGEG